MSSLFDNLSDELFQVLKGSGKTLTLYDANGNKTYEPKKARRVFAEPDKMMVSINEAGSDSEVKLYLSQDTDLNDVEKLINTLRMISTRSNVLFNVRKYGHTLSPKDFAYQVEPMAEAAMFGSSKTSYQKIGNAKLIVRHCAPVSEGVFGSRARNILNIFVETKLGERFRFPVIHLSGSRAFAQHLNQGGTPYDDMGRRIVELAQESTDLANVNRYIYHSKRTLSEDAVALRPTIRERVAAIRSELLSLARPRGYQRALELAPAKSIINLQESEGQLEQEVARLSTLLNINSNHALAESLMPVALLTLGETVMKKIDEMFYKGIAVPSSLMQQLAEALVNEYGYEEGVEWSYVQQPTHRAMYFEDSNAMADAHDLLENIIGCGYVAEDEEDKVLAYAKNWYIGRNKAMGAADTLTKDQEPAAEQLAQGLKAVLTGQTVATAKYPAAEETPKFADENAQYAWELSLYLEPKAGLKNDALFNYIGSIVTKLQEGQKLTQTEKLVMTKLIDQVDDLPSVGESALEAFVGTLEEAEGTDQILTYATKWVSQRHGAELSQVGINKKEEEKDIAKAAAELADGLRTVLSKQKVANAAYPAPEETPSFADINAQFAYELGLYLEPSAGLKNDALFTYISTLINKMQEGQKLTPSETLVRDQLLDMIDDSAHHGHHVDETVVDETMDDDPYYDPNHATVEEVVSHAHEEFDPVAFVDSYFPELREDGSVEDPLEPEYVIKSIAHWFNQCFEDSDLNGYENLASQEAQHIWDKGEVRAEIKKAGWKFTDDSVTESRGPRNGKLDTYIHWNGEDDVEVEVEYDVDYDDASTGYSGDGPIITSVVIKATGDDVLDVLDQKTLDTLWQEIADDLTSQAADRADYEYDRARDDRLMDEDAAIAVAPELTVGTHVATDFGPGKIVDVEGDRALVEMPNGTFKELNVADVDVVETKMKEEVELEEWFDSFDPAAILAPEQLDEYQLDGDNSTRLATDDRVVHKVYGPGTVIEVGEKFVKVKFDRKHARLPADATVTVSPGILYKRTGSIFKDKAAPMAAGDKIRRKEPHVEVMEELHDDLADYFDDYKLENVWSELKHFAGKVLSNPGSYDLPDPENLPYDDTDEAVYEFTNGFRQLMTDKLADLLDGLRDGLAEGEELNELSPARRKEYMDRAEQSMMSNIQNADHYRREAEKSHNPDKWYAGAEKADAKAARRAKGLGRAYAAESAERIDELSRDSLINYFDRGAQERGKLEKKAVDGDDEAAKKLAKRDQGLERAFKKMHEDEDDGVTGPTYWNGDFEGKVEDFLNAVYTKCGWAVHEQARNIIEGGQPFEEQNSNALRMMAEVAKSRGEDEFLVAIDDYLNDMMTSEAIETDLVLPGDAGDAFVSDVERKPTDNDAGLDGEPGKYQIYGKTFTTRMFPSDEEANAFMAKHEGEWGVIGVKDSMVHVARMDDEGIQEALGMQRLLTLAGRKK